MGRDLARVQFRLPASLLLERYAFSGDLFLYLLKRRILDYVSLNASHSRRRKKDARGGPRNNPKAAFEGTIQEREGGLRTVGAGRCDLKIVTSILQLSKKRGGRG
jgi:hypothetical protein